MRRITLTDELRRTRPEIADPQTVIAEGNVRVDGVVVLNPNSLVRPGCAIVVERPSELRGSVKLRAALDSFGVDVAGRICLDVGAATGGFTTVLLERGAARVYAVDAGHGQLLGSLRLDPRVVNLEATNVGSLDAAVIADTLDVITIDVSYLALREAVAQLDRLSIAPGAQLVGLVKPMFELALGGAPTDRSSVGAAVDVATRGIAASGWVIDATMDSPITGAKGAPEAFVLARRA